MDYIQYTFFTDPETAEFLPAFLADHPFDTFIETPDGFDGFVPANADAPDIGDYLDSLAEDYPFSWQKTLVPHQNWNEVWESNFQPIRIDDFCAVRADFHAPFGDQVRFDLLINPKMAFGTGHHETTHMCLAALEHIDVKGQKILDYGCGTGILAILASKLGAAELEAIDIEEESYKSTIENCADNDVHNVTSRCGTIVDVQGCDFDGILANINRNIIMESLPRLNELCKPGGWMLTSGFLRQDEGTMVEAAAKHGFVQKSINQKGNWLCILFEKEK